LVLIPLWPARAMRARALCRSKLGRYVTADFVRLMKASEHKRVGPTGGLNGRWAFNQGERGLRCG
jgi:hypothetical protein